MHINPVAFAFAVWVFSSAQRRTKTSLEDLINFGFEKSGLSCADKMQLYNSEREDILIDVEKAASYYNVLASEAASGAKYFTGAIEVLQDLQTAGVQNFITSAVEQDVLDTWGENLQGRMIARYLTEILGKRPNFSKGRDHFDYVWRVLNKPKIYYVADATAEIQTAKEYAQDYNITAIGFGNVITVDQVLAAVKLVSRALTACGIDRVPFPMAVQQIHVDGAKVTLPTAQEIETTLCKAGAESVISGTRETIMHNLRGYFDEHSMAQKRASL